MIICTYNSPLGGLNQTARDQGYLGLHSKTCLKNNNINNYLRGKHKTVEVHQMR